MSKTANNLSEAFLKVRNYLWDGTGELAHVFPRQDICICFAATKAKKDKAITAQHTAKIHEVMMDRLGYGTTIHRYLRRNHGITDRTPEITKQIQDYRHAWLIALSKEFADESANT